MKVLHVLLTLVIGWISVYSQNPYLEVGKKHKNLSIPKNATLNYKLKLKKNKGYHVFVMQRGIDVTLALTDSRGNRLIEKDSPNGISGLEDFYYSPKESSVFNLIIQPLEEGSNFSKGVIDIYINEINEKNVAILERENRKSVLTLDIDHFWEAFDHLKSCKTYADSIASFQQLYIDRATDGLLDFIKEKNFSAEQFINTVSAFPKFYNSIRPYTYEVKKIIPAIDSLFIKFQQLYPPFRPFKVCFAIGLVSSGGTTSDRFILIGSEVVTSTEAVDLSEFQNNSFKTVLNSKENIIQKLKNYIAHESVHTQQINPLNKDAIGCDLLYWVLKEGMCDFIGELLSGSQINNSIIEYGNHHEDELWQNLKNELCSKDYGNWLYNYNLKDKPGDLGYYMGYMIVKEYYNNQFDKKKIISDIINMNDPIHFLQLSKYDQKVKQNH